VRTSCRRAGRVVMRDRELLTIDVPADVKEMGERKQARTDRSHGKQIRDDAA
jgi:5-methylthioadenosine/S-adenosylhomocysteine deaminase